jgi:hypothetical protein
VSNVSLVPAPTEQGAATCENCGAPLVADQRYCLACGHPCSPVRLAFLDVLAHEADRGGPFGSAGLVDRPAHGAPAYLPLAEPGTNGWLRRYSGLLSLLSVLLLCLMVGLLVGHWVTQGGTPSRQVVEVKGLSAAPAAAASTAPEGSSSAASPSTKAKEAKEEAEAAKGGAKETKVEKAPPPKPVKVTPTKLKKLSSTTGKKHQEEVNALGAQPIETGG